MTELNVNEMSFADIEEEIAGMLDVPDEELDMEQRLLMDAYLDELARLEQTKVDRMSSFVVNMKGRARAARDEAARLADKARAMEARCERVKRKYCEVMQARGLRKVSGEVYSISLRRFEKVEVTDLSAIADDPVLVRVKLEPDKRAIAEALKGGMEIPGCRLADSVSLIIR